MDRKWIIIHPRRKKTPAIRDNMDGLEDLLLSESKSAKGRSSESHLYVESKKKKLDL